MPHIVAFQRCLFCHIYRWKWASCSHSEWRRFSPINDHLVIRTQYLFGRSDLCSCLIEFCTKIESLTKWPLFFLQTEVFTKRPLLFYSTHQMTPYFSFALTERPPFFFSLSPKDPYFWGCVRTSPSLPYVSAPPREFKYKTTCRPTCKFKGIIGQQINIWGIQNYFFFESLCWYE